MKRPVCLFLLIVVILAVSGVDTVAADGLPPEAAPLIRHFYKVHNTCDNVEPFIRHQMKLMFDKDKTITPKLVKLLYADCMINVRSFILFLNTYT